MLDSATVARLWSERRWFQGMASRDLAVVKTPLQLSLPAPPIIVNDLFKHLRKPRQQWVRSRRGPCPKSKSLKNLVISVRGWPSTAKRKDL